MSAVRLTPHHPETPQARVHQVMRSLVYRIGVRETGRLLGYDEDTIRRRLDTGNLNAFGADDLMQLKKRERDEFGTRTLHDASGEAIYGPRALVINVDISGALMRESGEDGGIIAEAAAIMEDGKIDKADLPRLETLLTKLQARQEHAQELEAGVRRKIDALKTGGR